MADWFSDAETEFKPEIFWFSQNRLRINPVYSNNSDNLNTYNTCPNMRRLTRVYIVSLGSVLARSSAKDVSGALFVGRNQHNEPCVNIADYNQDLAVQSIFC